MAEGKIYVVFGCTGDREKEIKMTLYCGLQNQSLKIRRLNGIAHGALDIQAGILSALAFQ